jgi:hypothetical protein
MLTFGPPEYVVRFMAHGAGRSQLVRWARRASSRSITVV